MEYIYKHLITQNIAPIGAKQIGVYNSSNKKICSIPLGKLAASKKQKLYSFGLISDTHMCPEATNGSIVSSRFEYAMNWFKEQGAVFVAHCGDITNVGFVDSSGEYFPDQFVEYQRICNLYPNLPVYACSGNHESYHAPLINYQDEYVSYVGHDINFTVTHENDVFIFLGMPKATTLYVDGAALPVPELAWLENQLTVNANKRCFVFIHLYMDDDSGDTLDKNPNDLLPVGYVSNTIKNALKNHGRAILFHGHSHFMPSMQEIDKLTNYTDINGFPSFHVSSLGWAAYVNDSGEYIKDVAEGFGNLVDVYDDCIMINSWDFTRNQWCPLGTFKIDITV